MQAPKGVSLPLKMLFKSEDEKQSHFNSIYKAFYTENQIVNSQYESY